MISEGIKTKVEFIINPTGNCPWFIGRRAIYLLNGLNSGTIKADLE
jgi:hypothetical protein